jgi:hypothetical protein
MYSNLVTDADGLTACVPLAARAELHAPDAVQPVTPVADHVRVEAPPGTNSVGLAASVRVGATGAEAAAV